MRKASLGSKTPEEPSKGMEPVRSSNDSQDWQMDSTYDSKNLTTTRDLDNFMATLGVLFLACNSNPKSHTQAEEA